MKWHNPLHQSKSLAAALTMIMLCSGSAADIRERDYQESTLVNGMTIITYARRSWEHFELHLWIHTGSVHEGIHAETGLNHLLEHALFCGSEPIVDEQGDEIRPGYEYEEIAERIHRLGGTEQASSDTDHTVVTFRVMPRDVPEAVTLLEAMVFRPSLDPSVLLGPELNVLMEEVRSADATMWRQRARVINRLCWGSAGYGARGVGDRMLTPQLTAADLRRFHHDHYVPNNMCLVVIGPVEHANIAQIASEVFVGNDRASPLYPPRPLAPVTAFDTPLPPLGQIHWLPIPDDTMPIADLAYRVPSLTPRIRACLTVLAEVAPSMFSNDDSIGGQVVLFPDLFARAGTLVLRTRSHDEDALVPSLQRAHRILASLEPDSLGTLDLPLAKSRILERLEAMWESPGDLPRALGGTLGPGDALEKFKRLERAVHDVTVAQLADACEAICRDDNYVIVGHRPPVANNLQAERDAQESRQLVRSNLKNGIPVAIRQNVDSSEAALALAFPRPDGHVVPYNSIRLDDLVSVPDGVAATLRFDTSLAIVTVAAEWSVEEIAELANEIVDALTESELAMRTPSRFHDADIWNLLIDGGRPVVQRLEILRRMPAIGVCGPELPNEVLNGLQSTFGMKRFDDHEMDDFMRPAPSAREVALTHPLNQDQPLSIRWFLQLPGDPNSARLFHEMAYHLNHRLEVAVRARGWAYQPNAYIDARYNTLVLACDTWQTDRRHDIELAFQRELETLVRAGVNASEHQEYMAHLQFRQAVAMSRASEAATLLATQARAESPEPVQPKGELVEQWLRPELAIRAVGIPGEYVND